MTVQQQVYTVADELRAIANLGAAYGTNPYDLERYRKVLQASARLVAALEGREPEEVLGEYRGVPPSASAEAAETLPVLGEYQGDLGHISPLNGADAVVIREGRVLLIRRRDSGLWALPGGLVDVGDTLAGAAVRELQEETGLVGRAERYLGHFDSRQVGSRLRFQMFHHSFLVEAHGEPGPSNETLAADFFAPDALPQLHFEHGVMVPRLLALLHSGEASPLFDR
ncbi:NUDIX hydrolase N-terminal domain-containing protein [Deinococcus altitudinis]|uniref:NUDIX hydrolase N-terminal domain-containing protein n=1 Tax=Deinococcus altitudinis TaxID=468914 RepID=UPI0038917B3C